MFLIGYNSIIFTVVFVHMSRFLALLFFWVAICEDVKNVRIVWECLLGFVFSGGGGSIQCDTVSKTPFFRGNARVISWDMQGLYSHGI